MSDIVLKAEDIRRNYLKNSKDYDSDIIRVLKGINCTIEKGQFVGIMGKSGCGKTTLLKILGLIDKESAGTLIVNGKSTKDMLEDELSDLRRRGIGFVFQDFYLMDGLNVQDNIMLPMILDKKDADICYSRSEEFARLFMIEHLLHKNVYELSGGERQRVAICRALMNDPDLILADEPTGNLDSKAGKVVIDTLTRINKELQKTIVMVTHDPKMASYCDRLILLKDGVVIKELNNSGEEFYHQILNEMEIL